MPMMQGKCVLTRAGIKHYSIGAFVGLISNAASPDSIGSELWIAKDEIFK